MSFSSASGRENNVRKLSFLGFNTKKKSGNEDPDEVLLDSEMEKVFAGANARKDKFDVNTFQDNSQLPIGSRKKSSVRPNDLNIEEDSEYESQTEPLNNAQNYDDIPEDFPLVSERAGHGDHSDNSADEKHVQFGDAKKKIVITPPSLSYDEQPTDQSHERKRRKSRHQYYRQRKFSHQDSVEPKKTIEENGDAGARRISVQPEDTALETNGQMPATQEADLNELRSHRSDDPRAMRRHKIHHSSIKLRELPQITISPFQNKKPEVDHSPHEIFVQLDELTGVGEDREWKETARWIKYEEDVEEGSDRWGKPHVASLSFHSLLNLRRCLETGVVLLDLNEKDLPAVAYRVVEQMVVDDLIDINDKPSVMRSLLLRHRHVNEHQGVLPFTKRKYNSYTSLQLLWMGTEASQLQQQQQQQQLQRNLAKTRRSICVTSSAPPAAMLNVGAIDHRRHSTTSYLGNLSGTTDDKKIKIMPANEIGGSKRSNELKIDMKDDMYSSSQEDLKKLQNDTILRRIPAGAEATTVLVGAVEFLEQPTIAFVRLSEGVMMPSLTEVPVPVRFMFVLLGPLNFDLDYHEVGRSISTLMANEHFHAIAYKADDRRDLLSAINEFLDDSIVLPPGNWDRHDLLPFDELKAKKDWIRTRKIKALQVKRDSEMIKIGRDEEKLLLDKQAMGAIAGPGGPGGDGDDDDRGDGKKKKPNPMDKTHRLWGGLCNDLKRRMPMYKSDILDGLNTETLAATIFMYFACLSTAITFGGLASAKTDSWIGISETLIACSLVGIIFHCFSCQPLVIIGTTGPLLLFDEALMVFCTENKFDFLSLRVYVGIWLIIIALCVSAFEGSVYVRLLTRFTQEIFSALITLIYIVETMMKLVSIYKLNPLLADYNLPPPTLVDHYNITSFNVSVNLLNETTTMAPPPTASSKLPINQPNTALFCTILTLATFVVAYYLKLFRNSHFLGRNARRALGDFGVPISIAIFVLVDYLVPSVYTEKLVVPEGLSPSDPTKRGWFIGFNTNFDTWVPFACVVPALLVYILIFMESQISELIVDKPERGLKKGSGLHWDIVLLCLLNTFCGLFGMPWHCAATVRSVTHVSSVTIMSRTHAPGESPRIIDVKEQRVSGFFVCVMIGLSVLMSPLLRLIPMAVLFGVFLYMGIASMSGVQFFERVRLYFMPVKHYPPTNYVKRVRPWKLHLFTTIQVLCLVVLWSVKSSKFSLAFPFFLILMVPIRQRLTSLYKPEELQALDGSEVRNDESEPDFYEQTTIPA
ncbi:hypothetical protein ACLKA7_016450 [Drosophila subpalustris]